MIEGRGSQEGASGTSPGAPLRGEERATGATLRARVASRIRRMERRLAPRLRELAQDPETGRLFRDLLLSAPAIAAQIADAASFTGDAVVRRNAARLASLPRTEILHRLGWRPAPVAPALPKLLAKVVPEAVNSRRLLRLRRRLAEEPSLLERFCHMRRVNADAFELLLGCDLGVTPELVREAAGREFGRAHATTAALLRSMRRLQRRTGWPAKYEYSTLADVLATNEELEFAMELERTFGLDTLLAEPPFPGDVVFVPLATCRSVLTTGQATHNCMGGPYSRQLLRAVRQGASFFYRSRAPLETGMMHVVRCPPDADLAWDVAEVRGFANAPPTRALVTAARRFVLREPVFFRLPHHEYGAGRLVVLLREPPEDGLRPELADFISRRTRIDHQQAMQLVEEAPSVVGHADFEGAASLRAEIAKCGGSAAVLPLQEWSRRGGS